MTNSSGTTSGRRALARVVGLLASGSVVMLIAASRPWVPIGGWKVAGFPVSSMVMTGYPEDRRAVTGIGLALLAAVVAVLASRGVLRRVVGGLVMLTAVVACVPPLAHATLGPWPLVTVGGALAAAVAGGLVAWRGHVWPSMSTRYEREARAASRPPTPWEAIDRGEDPTA